jgi:ABC-type glycerol-3-phosphate transport system permease component
MTTQSRTTYVHLIGAVLRYTVLEIGLSVTLLPFVYVLLSSLKTPSEYYPCATHFFPQSTHLAKLHHDFQRPQSTTRVIFL